jgi:hypothetical protein
LGRKNPYLLLRDQATNIVYYYPARASISQQDSLYACKFPHEDSPRVPIGALRRMALALLCSAEQGNERTAGIDPGRALLALAGTSARAFIER